MAAVAAGYRIPVGIEFTAAPPMVRWQSSDGSRFTEPFFDDTLRRLRRTHEPSVGRGVLREAWPGPPPPLPPLAIIFHTSRCGSTLVSRMLAALPDHLVVSEARVFDDILRGPRLAGAAQVADGDRWLRHAAAAFVASQAVPPGRLVIKLDCWHIFALPRVRRAFPGVPLLFVYRDPLEVLVSLMAQPSLTMVRDVVTPEEIGITRDARDALSREDLAAAILGAFFRQAATHRPLLTPIAYPSLPSGVWTSLPWIAPAGGDVDRLRDAARDDAKRPGTVFEPDSARKRRSASAAVREACARWAAPAYEAWLASV
jgi:hypothetical protein